VSAGPNINLKGLKAKDSSFIAKYLEAKVDEVEALDLSHARFTSDIDHLVKFLRYKETKLNTLSLNYCGIGSTQLSHLCNALKHTVSLKQVGIAGLDLGKQARLIEIELVRHKHIQMLDLSYNQIYDAYYVCKMIQSSPYLQTLKYEGNPLGQEGA